MSSPEIGDNKRTLYLQQIDVEGGKRIEFRIKLLINKNDVEIRQQGRTLTWIPSRSLELTDASNIVVYVKSGLKYVRFGRLEASTQISAAEAMAAFWESKESISSTITFDQQPMTITFKFRPTQTAKTTRAAVQNIQTAMESYSSLMTVSTEYRIDIAIKYGVAVSEVNPFAKVAFGLARVTFELLKEQRKYDEMVSDLASGIGRILPFATQVLDDLVYDETDLLDGAIRKWHELVIETAQFIVGYTKRSPATKAIISMDDRNRIDTLQEDFVKLKEDFDRAVDIAALKIARRNEELRLLDRLKPVDAANYQDHRGCMDGTRTKVLEDIVSWGAQPFHEDPPPDESSTHSILWLCGLPGIGKTSVANSLCDRLRKGGYLGGSFFCRRDDPILREPRCVLPTLISKLAGMWAPFRKLVAQALHEDPQLTPESNSGELLLKPLESLRRHPPRTLVLVIDALDECGDPSTRKRLLQCLKKACSLVRWLKIVIASRPEHDIQSFLDTCSAVTRDLATDDQTGSDIRLFMESRMESVASRRYLPRNWPGEERLNQLIERSGGLFIFVDTVYRFVDGPDPEPLLAQVLEGGPEGPVTELHKLYAKAITSRTEQRSEAFRSILQAIVVVATYRPLCDETLASLIGLESRIVRSWVDELSALLYRDGAEKYGIRVRHLSIREFLVGPTCPPEFRVDLNRAHAELGYSCLTMMKKELRFNICELETSRLSNVEVEGLSDRVEQKIPDGLQYSCMHWPSHLCSDLNPVSKEVTELLDGFFEGAQPFYWLEVLSLMEKIPAAILALRRIRASSKKFKDRHQHLFTDTLRFVLAFSIPISTSAPHIYLSAFPFMPTESTLWKHTRGSFPHSINVCRGRMTSWPDLAGVWQGHTGGVNSVAYSPDGLHVISGSRDGTIRTWDTETGAVVGEPLKGHDDDSSVVSVAYSPNGRHVISGSSDKTIRIWDAETGVAVGDPMRGHLDWVRSVSYSPDGRRIVSSSSDTTVRIWDAETGEAVCEPLRGHVGSVWSVAYSPDGRHIISGSDDTTIRIWDSETGMPVGDPLRGHIGRINSVAYAPGGQKVVSGSYDNTIRIWDMETGAVVGKPLKGHTDHVLTVGYLPDGRRIISGSSDQTVRIWDAETGEAVGEPLRGHVGSVWSVTYSPDGRRIVSGSSDNAIRIWDAETGALMGEASGGHGGSAWSVVYSPDGRHLASSSADKTLRIWDVETGAAVGRPITGQDAWRYTIAYSPDGQRIASGSFDNTVRIWDAETGAAVGEPLRGHAGQVKGVVYSPHGLNIVSISDDRTLRIWDAKTGLPVGGPLRGHTARSQAIAYSPSGRHIVSGSSDKTIRIWDAATGAAVGEPLRGHEGTIWSVAYSPDGRHIVSSSADTTIRIWDVKRGAVVGEPLRGHAESAWSVAYSPDGRHIVSGSADRMIRIWDAETGEAVGEPLRGHAGSVWTVAYSHDGTHVVSSSEDKTIRIWVAETRVKDDGYSTLCNLGDLSNQLFPVAAFSGLPIHPEQLDSNGWVRDAEGLLFWVPEDCRHGLTCHAVMTIPNMGRQRCVRLDFTEFQYGTSWTKVHG